MTPNQLPVVQRSVPTAPQRTAQERLFLNTVRFISLTCRAKAREDLFEACALLAVDRDASRDAHIEALVRCLHEALGKRAVLYGPGTLELSFDESWLVQLATSLAREDELSTNFLLHSRVKPHHRRHVSFLVGRIAECFNLV